MVDFAQIGLDWLRAADICDIEVRDERGGIEPQSHQVVVDERARQRGRGNSNPAYRGHAREEEIARREAVALKRLCLVLGHEYGLAESDSRVGQAADGDNRHANAQTRPPQPGAKRAREHWLLSNCAQLLNGRPSPALGQRPQTAQETGALSVRWFRLAAEPWQRGRLPKVASGFNSREPTKQVTRRLRIRALRARKFRLGRDQPPLDSGLQHGSPVALEVRLRPLQRRHRNIQPGELLLDLRNDPALFVHGRE